MKSPSLEAGAVALTDLCKNLITRYSLRPLRALYFSEFLRGSCSCRRMAVMNICSMLAFVAFFAEGALGRKERNE